ncbi:hypothetical protein ACOMHN_020202 [Nucella lapillus]
MASSPEKRAITKRPEFVPLITYCRKGDLESVRSSIDKIKVYINEQDTTGRTPLHAACFHGRVDVVDFLLERSAKVNARNDKGDTPLLEACRSQEDAEVCSDVVRKLIEKNADVNICADNGTNPLIEACIHDHPEIVQQLLYKGAKTGQTDIQGYTAMDWAILKGHVGCLIRLTKHAETDVNVHSGDGKTPLHRAVESYNINIVLLLLELTGSKKVQINAVDMQGDTPLHIAIRKGFDKAVFSLVSENPDCCVVNHAGDAAIHVVLQVLSSEQVVESVAERTLNINVKNKENCTPLHLAVLSGSLVQVGMILRHREVSINLFNNDIRTALFLACEKNFEMIFLALMENGADVNIPDKDRNAPLHLAVNFGQDSIAQMLINHDSTDLNLKDKLGRTALLIACKRSCTYLVKDLIGHHADINIKDDNGESALVVACKLGLFVTVRKLVLHPLCQINISGKDRRTPLQIACEQNRAADVRLLVEFGADVNCVNPLTNSTALHEAIKAGNEGTINLLIAAAMSTLDVADVLGATPLSLACQKGQTDVVRALLKRKAKANTTDLEDKSPLYWAVEQRDEESVTMLLDAGACVNQADVDGRTPLYVACEKRLLAIVSLLMDGKADPSIEDRGGVTPIKIAERKKETNLLKVLHSRQNKPSPAEDESPAFPPEQAKSGGR